jgi:hypothetical protein|tara:strand:- start:16 stop:264 length:249 start_codon:yes stop_codon:yes gene_type:complete
MKKFANQVILKKYVNEEGFDSDGIGDYSYIDERYQSFNSLEEVLLYLKKSIYNDDRRTKPNFNTIKEYCDTFEFEIYERKVL